MYCISEKEITGENNIRVSRAIEINEELTEIEGLVRQMEEEDKIG